MKPRYEIAIPSYDRPETIRNKTLKYLEETNHRGRITVFVASRAEKERYGPLGAAVRVVVGVPTLSAQRVFISNYYPVGTRIFNIEDDIPGIFYAPSPKRLELVKDLNSLIESGFEISERAGTKLWGLSASCNPFYIHGGKVSTNLKFIDGACYGTINTHDKSLHSTLPVKEDYQRCILYYLKFGAVVRFNGYAAKNSTYKEKGGIGAQRNAKNSKESAEYLIKKYPHFVRLNPKRDKTEFTEILLRS